MPASTLPKSWLSEVDYLTNEESAEGRSEYLNGKTFELAICNRTDAAICTTVAATLHSLLRGKRCRAYNRAMRLRIERGADLRFYFPDAMVVCQKSTSAVWEDAPSVVIEVLSESTDRIDLGEKRDAYFGIATLQTYMVIDSRRMEVTVFRRNATTWTSTVHQSPEDQISFPEVECELTLAEIYEGALSPI